MDELRSCYDELYKGRADAAEQFDHLVEIMKKGYEERKVELKKLDADREQAKEWFLDQKVVGMMMYIDLFADNFTGVQERISYLKELGITYIHFMPLLKTRKGKNDGGYAVASYTQVDERFGNIEQFENLLDALREQGISTCVDFVVNHTAKEHDWALRAKAGDVKYQEMYFMYDTDLIPNQFEKTVPEVFPLVSPKNFTYYEDIEKWVFTSFYEFQWDLNYQNPYVLSKIIERLLFLANKGVEVFRLDAIPFMWKELGTNCRNLPPVHSIMSIFRIISEIVCPGIILKGEAIVAPQEIVKYFGDANAAECHIMYNASYMVLLWNSLATRDVRLMEKTLARSPRIPLYATWINYARCHDDIGWGFEEGIIREIGEDPFLHKQFLISFYKGDFPGSFSRGELYEFDETTMDARNSGTLASLCGLEKALGDQDEYQQELAIKRILLLHSMIISFSGIPVIYSGDEIGTVNDFTYVEDPQKSADSRWLHRPKMDWERAAKRADLGSDEGKIFTSLQKMIQCRKEHPIFASNVECTVFDTQNQGVFGLVKQYHGQKMLILGNFTESQQRVNNRVLREQGFCGIGQDLLQGRSVDFHEETLVVGPYQYLWIQQI